MDYRKTIKLYEEDGKTVMCDFDIVLNRSMAVGALKGYPNLVDVIFNGVGLDVEDAEPSNLMMQLITEGKADKLFAINDDMPEVICNLFPQMLDAGTIRVGCREEILEIATAFIFGSKDEEENKFLTGLTTFFMTALRQNEKVKPKIKLPKFTMN